MVFFQPSVVCRIGVLAAGLLGAASCVAAETAPANAAPITSASQPAAAPALVLRVDGQASVPVHGAMNYDKAGTGAGAMLYPAPGLVGLLAAVATHAIISDGMRESEKTKLRETADQFLLPYQPALAAYRYSELIDGALPLVESGGAVRSARPGAAMQTGEHAVDIAPMYFMTQDGRALILESAVVISAVAPAKPYASTIRVVSPAQPADGQPEAWFADGAARLRKHSMHMLAQLLDIAVRDSRAAPLAAAPFKTVRYSEGGSERMERAQVLAENCERIVLRTLRGNLMAVPPQTLGEGCTAPQ